MVKPIDSAGNVHGENGQFVSLRSYIEAILSEKEKQTEFSRVQLERALVEARTTTERAMTQAAVEVEKRLVEAKVAADERAAVVQQRIDLLESGGAPFASRLDESLSKLKGDVDILNTNMVRTTVLDALREQTVAEAKAQKRQIRYIALAAAFSLVVSLILVGIRVLT
jgi:mRNA degradation ribonuclease J1/J2